MSAATNKVMRLRIRFLSPILAVYNLPRLEHCAERYFCGPHLLPSFSEAKRPSFGSELLSLGLVTDLACSRYTTITNRLNPLSGNPTKINESTKHCMVL
jgi:hypothetical protein